GRDRHVPRAHPRRRAGHRARALGVAAFHSARGWGCRGNGNAPWPRCATGGRRRGPRGYRRRRAGRSRSLARLRVSSLTCVSRAMMLRHLPNLICIARIGLVWPTVAALERGNFELAMLLFIVAAVSDGLDGYLAKR